MQKEIVDVIVEISKFESQLKLEMDQQHKILRVDRLLKTTLAYPLNYGYIPHTQGADGDPLDAFIVGPILPINTIIRCRIIGAVSMIDNNVADDKIIVVPNSAVSKKYDSLCMENMNRNLKKQLVFFLENYKKLDKKNLIEGVALKDLAYALRLLEGSLL